LRGPFYCLSIGSPSPRRSSREPPPFHGEWPTKVPVDIRRHRARLVRHSQPEPTAMRLHDFVYPLAAFLMAVAAPAAALSDPPAEVAAPPMLPDSGPRSFPAARDRILADLEARDVYVHIRESERREVIKALERMGQVLEGVD